MTYNELLAQVRRYIERGFTAQSDPLVYEEVPELISKAERRCARELKILGFLASMQTTMQPGTGVYAKPDGWTETAEVWIGTGETFSERVPIFPRSYSYCRSYWPNSAETGQPQFYADYVFTHWLVVPTPVLAYPAEFMVWRIPPVLSPSRQNNWLSDNAPDLLLYATLLEAAPFLRNEEQVALWQGFYDRHMQATNGQDLQNIIDRSQKRTTI